MIDKPLIVLKFGTASITLANGEPDRDAIFKIATEISSLHKSHRIVIVSSGAVGAGKHHITNYQGSLSQRKAAAAVGNPLLLQIYAQAFSAYGITIAQSLCERGHFSKREQFLQLKLTYTELWENGIIPIANENDVVSSRELKFSDNDELATLIAVGFEAEQLMICTSVGGFLDQNKAVLPFVSQIDDHILSMVDSSKSALGLGGMASKLTFAKLANKMGIEVYIFGIGPEQGILKALNLATGTRFAANERSLSARNKWLASGSVAVGKIALDAGAARAIRNRSSLLAVGIKKIYGDFDANDVVELTDHNDETIAIAKVKASADVLAQNLKTTNFEVANANDIVVW
jgi:glutamate 5-kinase